MLGSAPPVPHLYVQFGLACSKGSQSLLLHPTLSFILALKKPVSDVTVALFTIFTAIDCVARAEVNQHSLRLYKQPDRPVSLCSG